MTNWGILSCGKVSHDFCTSLRYENSPHNISAVATRNNLESAETFAKLHNAKKAYGSYEELLSEDAEIDVIYIGTLHVFHYEWTKKCLNAGKHVLCEKPITLNSKQAEELFHLAESKNLFLMEGMWSRFTPVYKKIIETIESGKIGEICSASSSFSFDGTAIPRITEEKLGGSAILDIGLYANDFCLMAFGDVDPDYVDYAGVIDPKSEQVDTVSRLSMHFLKRGTADAFSCTLFESKNFGQIIGTKGSIRPKGTHFHTTHRP